MIIEYRVMGCSVGFWVEVLGAKASALRLQNSTLIPRLNDRLSSSTETLGSGFLGIWVAVKIMVPFWVP